MSEKGKLALYWGASCGGCEIAVLGIDDKILQVADAFDIVFWPVAVDAKVRSIEKMEDKSIDLCLFNGAIRTSEQEYMARLLRQKSKVLVAFGSCAHEGCIPGLANMTDKEAIFQTAYHDTPSTHNPDDVRPQTETEVAEGTLTLPYFYETVKTLDQTIDVDYYLPGCPPEPERIWDALTAILTNQLPPPGTVIGETTTVCDVCPREREEKKIKEFKRTWEIIPDPDKCLLDQGIICCGIATRAGCGALCPTVGSPCIGCYGPNEGVEDFGARMMSALASVIDSDDPAEIDRIIQEGIPDPMGSFYRFSMAHGELRRVAPISGNGKPGEPA
ncbi:MAG: F420-nonreducing hydrogenase [Anaerolineales bacterium]|nr:F420-nonreducing hydrogenase [Anaerolineales bacterium]